MQSKHKDIASNFYGERAVQMPDFESSPTGRLPAAERGVFVIGASPSLGIGLRLIEALGRDCRVITVAEPEAGKLLRDEYVALSMLAEMDFSSLERQILGRRKPRSAPPWYRKFDKRNW